ncbi:MAG: hypothetical protein NZO58_12005 [Gemmataceae bacterium]|nr:hypothetical protein [Gemmataceae bacterium]
MSSAVRLRSESCGLGPVAVAAATLACLGCSEGIKSKPLPSALTVNRPVKDDGGGSARELVDRLGGREGIKRIADALLIQLGNDDDLPPSFRLQFLAGDREPQPRELERILREVAAGQSGRIDFGPLRVDDAAVRRRIEQLVDAAAHQAGVGPVERAELKAAWQKASAGVK